MNRKVYGGILLVFACFTAGLLMSCGGGSGNKAVLIAATSGSSQSATVGAAFAATLVATVTTGGTPTSGVMVTFTAPGSGASGTFANGMASETDATNSSGVATSTAFTANTKAGAYSVSASAPGSANPASYNLTNNAGPAAAVAATSGTPQSATVKTAFAAPLVATVTDSHGNPVSASVTFTAPGSGASGKFMNGTATEMDTANASGVATSTTFTANATIGPYTVTAIVNGVAAPANFSLTNTAAVPVIAVQSGSGQSATVSTAFGAPLVVTVMSSGVPVSGASVTFTAPGSGASGTFTNHTNTETDLTNASGVATSTAFTANATAGGPYTVTATTTGAAGPANFSLTNTAVVAGSKNFAFYLSGNEQINTGPNYYALAGAVAIAADGTVTGGVQDYNDGVGVLSPQPSGDTITGGKLTISSTTGQGTLTLITNNTKLGAAATPGTETFGVQFVNANHALILQYDGSATSSGSMDLQTLGSPVINGGLAFILTGADSTPNAVAIGGVATNSAAGLSGTSDINDNGVLKLNSPFSGATIQPVSGKYGRGTITGIKFAGAAFSLNYYMVRPNVIRIIDVDAANAVIGSAFGQGTNATAASNGSLGASVLYLAGNPWQTTYYGAVAQFTTSNTGSNSADFAGVGDDNELATAVATDSAVSGNYTISSNGYGSMTVNGLGGSGPLSLFMTDPTLNLNDPNSATGGGGGLLLDQSVNYAGGTGFVVPQTDTAKASFAGNYAVGWQNFNNFSTGCSQCEFDMAAQGTVAANAGAMSFSGLVSDPFLTLTAGPALTTATLTGTPQADAAHAGRYTMSNLNSPANPLTANINGGSGHFDLVIYQASGGQLFWLEVDNNGVFAGPLAQQGSLTGLPAVVTGPAANSQDPEKP